MSEHQLLLSPWRAHFQELIQNASSSLLLCFPYIGTTPCELIKFLTGDKKEKVKLNVLTDLSPKNILSGSIDVGAVLSLIEAFPSSEIRFLRNIHAKIYIADKCDAIVTSGNMTDNGLSWNFEYGVRFKESSIVKQIREDVLSYSALGTLVSLEQLRVFLSISNDLISRRKEIEKKQQSKLIKQFKVRLIEAENQVFSIRIADRSPHAIFADAIRYFLKKGPLSTVQLHHLIQCAFPDICDDSIYRMIDGKPYTIKWKHTVRQAQGYLKEKKEIELKNGYWKLVEL